eukprot:8062122-Alexandrium_andersonii.AAC.1
MAKDDTCNRTNAKHVRMALDLQRVVLSQLRPPTAPQPLRRRRTAPPRGAGPPPSTHGEAVPEGHGRLRGPVCHR